MATAVEGSVDWKGAEAYMQRGEAADADGSAPDEGSTESEGVREFRYKGKTLKVDPDTYAALEEFRRDARGANGKLGSELAKTRERLAKLEGVLAARPPAESESPTIQPPDPTLATRDIAAWQQQMEAFHEAKMARLRDELEEKYVRVVTTADRQMKEAQREREWADGFYQVNDHLAHPAIKPIVSQAYVENREEIDALRETDSAAAYDRLAELADARLVQLRAAGKAGTNTETNTKRPPRLESAAGPTPRGKADDVPRDFTASSWVAKQRLRMTGREERK